MYNGEIYLCYFYPNSSKVIKSRRRGWVGHVARVGKGESYVGFEGEKLIERNYFQRARHGRKVNTETEVEETGW